MPETKVRTWPVVEIFGPTIQGEGIDQGAACHFVRFGGCDFACTWCDTPYAVLPGEVRKATRMSVEGIADELGSLALVPWVVLSGGNPALHDLTELVTELQFRGFKVAVETQGSRWAEWFKDVDRLCISPKPPSSLEDKATLVAASEFVVKACRASIAYEKFLDWFFIKVVCFTGRDVDYAERLLATTRDIKFYLSAGNDAGATVGNPDRVDLRTLPEVRSDLLDTAAWLTREVLERPSLCDNPNVFVQSQFHTLLWGNGRGF